MDGYTPIRIVPAPLVVACSCKCRCGDATKRASREDMREALGPDVKRIHPPLI